MRAHGRLLRFGRARGESIPSLAGCVGMTTAMAEPKTFSTRDFRLQSGAVMPSVTIAYATLGTLAPDRGNAVLVTHGNTSGPQMIDPGGSTGEGSWNELVGPGKAVDTNRFFAICPNMLGSSYGSTNAASIDPATGKPYGQRFPDITVSDIVGYPAPAARSSRHRKTGCDRRPVLWRIPGLPMGGQLSRCDEGHRRRRHLAPGAARAIRRGMSRDCSERCHKDPNWNGGDYYDRGGVLESMIQIRIATLKTYGIETRLKQTMSDPGTDRSRDPRRGGAMGERLRRQFADHPGQGAARLRRDGAIWPASNRRFSSCCPGRTNCFRRISPPASCRG